MARIEKRGYNSYALNTLRRYVEAHRAPNHQCCLDFVQDALAWGRKIRTLSVVDVFTREPLAIEVDTSLSGTRVIEVLERPVQARGACPKEIILDNGPELTSRALGQWAYEHSVRLRFIEPGKPQKNGHAESFNSRFRDECLNEHWFLSLADARRIIEDWRLDFVQNRPHSSLGNLTPQAYRDSYTMRTTPAGSSS